MSKGAPSPAGAARVEHDRTQAPPRMPRLHAHQLDLQFAVGGMVVILEHAQKRTLCAGKHLAGAQARFSTPRDHRTAIAASAA
ncbi:hypothetical protein [Comamonas antarctica]|uniref:Uncharacterized protein n=1 Tax=Comamonas antarctica TaxID=2743470 RepID=A0A6N1X3H9_9BURK|nr:hypothetical protein [Comamonas antarctica]QKV54004.1 hypothetical protein HUK68_14475 [Comamonas antarctica]